MKIKILILIFLLSITLLFTSGMSTDTSYYDVIVIGGEPEGVAAAVAAARNGSNTLLIDHRDGLGGLFTYGMLNQLDLGYDKDGKIANQGIFTEWHSMVGGKGTFDIEQGKESFLALVNAEENLDLTLNAEIINIIKQDNRVIGVDLKVGDKEQRIYADRFIDSTANADFAAQAGAPYFVGQEDIGQQDTKMAVTLVMILDGVDWNGLKQASEQKIFGGVNVYENIAWGFPEIKKVYKPVEEDVVLRGLNIGRQNDGKVTINALQLFGVDGLDENAKAEAIEKGKRETAHVVEFLRQNIPGFEKATVAGYPSELYIRETRHIIAEYQLSITDVWENKDHWDSIGIGAYPVDVQQTSVGGYGYYVTNPVQYAIPFRSLVPKEIDNLLVASKAAGYSSLAAGSARTVPIGMTAGEAAGTAAAISINHDIGFREMAKNESIINELQQQLREQGALLYEFELSYPYEGEWVYPAIKKLLPYGLIEAGYNNDLRVNQPMAERDFLKLLSKGIERSNPDLYGEIIQYFDPWEQAMATDYSIELTRDRAAEILLTLYGYENKITGNGELNWQTAYQLDLINEEIYTRINQNQTVLRSEGFHIVAHILPTP